MAEKGVGGLRVIQDLEHVWILRPDGTEEEKQVRVYVDWNGDARLVATDGEHIPISKVLTKCNGCGAVIHSWRSNNGPLPEDDLQEG